jgi:hypothetical protein
MAHKTRRACGSHRAVHRRHIRYKTSLDGNWSGALGAYCGTNLNLCPQSSHFPSPCVTSSHDVRQSWCVKPIEPEHLHGWNNGRLERWMNTNWEKNNEVMEWGKSEFSRKRHFHVFRDDEHLFLLLCTHPSSSGPRQTRHSGSSSSSLYS